MSERRGFKDQISDVLTESLPDPSGGTLESWLAPTTESRIEQIPVEQIRERSLRGDVDVSEPTYRALRASIRASGVLQPLLLRPHPEGGFEVVSGARRLRAARDTAQTSVPAVVRDLNDVQAIVGGSWDAVLRAGLTAHESRELVARLVGAGMGEGEATALVCTAPLREGANGAAAPEAPSMVTSGAPADAAAAAAAETVSDAAPVADAPAAEVETGATADPAMADAAAAPAAADALVADAATEPADAAVAPLDIDVVDDALGWPAPDQAPTATAPTTPPEPLPIDPTPFPLAALDADAAPAAAEESSNGASPAVPLIDSPAAAAETGGSAAVAAEPPAAEVPEAPVAEAPAASAAETPEAPAAEAPEISASQAPEAPAAEASEAAVAEAPAASAAETPEAPAAEAPEVAVAAAPEAPAAEAPEAAVADAPAASAGESPEAPAAEAPEVAVADPLQAPAAAAAEAAVADAPAASAADAPDASAAQAPEASAVDSAAPAADEAPDEPAVVVAPVDGSAAGGATPHVIRIKLPDAATAVAENEETAAEGSMPVAAPVAAPEGDGGSRLVAAEAPEPTAAPAPARTSFAVPGLLRRGPLFYAVLGIGLAVGAIVFILTSVLEGVGGTTSIIAAVVVAVVGFVTAMVSLAQPRPRT